MFAVKTQSVIHQDALKLTRNVCSSIIRSDIVKSAKAKNVSYRYFTSLRNPYGNPLVLTQINNYAGKRRLNINRPKSMTSKSPITWKSFLISASIGTVFIAYLLYLKNKKLELREKERKKALGKAKIGGRFDLVDQDNKPVKSEDLFGDWLLIYFGFTHCPDICPDEIEKMVDVVEKIEKREDIHNVKPIFITVDPERDSPSVVKKYVEEFSKKIIGLTGTVEQIAKVCKAFRVYFSSGPKDSDSDYIVDHSIIMYLIDPEGNFIDFYGQNKNADQIVLSIYVNQVKYDKLKSKKLTEKLQELVFG